MEFAAGVPGCSAFGTRRVSQQPGAVWWPNLSGERSLTGQDFAVDGEMGRYLRPVMSGHRRRSPDVACQEIWRVVSSVVATAVVAIPANDIAMGAVSEGSD